jgi:hypothetical protein
MIRRYAVAAATALMAAAFVAGPVAAHVHVAEKTPQQQELARGQNHPGFQPIDEDGLRLSCAGALEPADAGPAGYGLETAHHGPDAGDPGKADGCYAVAGNPVDGNPAIN